MGCRLANLRGLLVGISTQELDWMVIAKCRWSCVQTHAHGRTPTQRDQETDKAEMNRIKKNRDYEIIQISSHRDYSPLSYHRCNVINKLYIHQQHRTNARHPNSGLNCAVCGNIYKTIWKVIPCICKQRWCIYIEDSNIILFSPCTNSILTPLPAVSYCFLLY